MPVARVLSALQHGEGYSIDGPTVCDPNSNTDRTSVNNVN